MIRIFPAIPDSWQDVAYSGLRTEGAFKVSASRKDGRTQFIHIKSLAGEPCIIKTDICNPVFEGKRGLKVQSLAKDIYQIDIKKGEEIFIYPYNESTPFAISPLEHTTRNHFGVKIN